MTHDLDALVKKQALAGNSGLQSLLNNKWYDPETAPKDETRIIVYFAITQKKYYASWNEDKHARNPKPHWVIEATEFDLYLLKDHEFCKWRYDIEGPK